MDIPFEIYDSSEWRRHGRGRELQFFATDDEVRQYFRDLPGDLGSYSIIGTTLVPHGKKYRRRGFVTSLDDWLSAVAEGNPDVPRQFWLSSKATTALVPHDDETIDKWCAVNGLTLVQHGAARNEKRLASRIAVVNKIAHRTTGELRKLKHQIDVFDFLDQRIRRDLQYTTLQIFKDGHEEEDSIQLMTAAAAALARAGFFARMPGQLLK